MKVIKNILKNMVMIGAFIIIVTTPVFADVAVPAYNPVEDFIYDIFNGDEKVFVVGMVMIAVVIAIISAVVISKQEVKEEKQVETKNK